MDLTGRLVVSCVFGKDSLESVWDEHGRETGERPWMIRCGLQSYLGVLDMRGFCSGPVYFRTVLVTRMEELEEDVVATFSSPLI